MRALCTPSNLLAQSYMSSVIILTVIKTVHHLWILLITQNKCSYHDKMYARETQSHSTHPYNYALMVSHTITVQGIRNDDQSLSPVTPLVSLLFLSFLIP